jgi:hypothetical protein
VRDYHVARGYEDDKGNLRQSVQIEQSLRQEAAKYCNQLGMSPTSRAKLGVDLVQVEHALTRHLHENYGSGDAVSACSMRILVKPVNRVNGASVKAC